MHPVHYVMNTRGEEQTRNGDHHEAGVQRIETSKKLPRLGELLSDRPHATQEHGGVEESITPRQVLIVLVAPHSQGE
jgi:hypothetical protein